MSPNVILLVLSSLFFGTMITLSSSHWLVAWMGLEINTLAIIPLMVQQYHPRSVEASTKYFLVQATTAATLLFASLTNAWLTGQWDIQLMTHPIPTTMIILALSMKLGLAPLHTWLPEVLQGLDLTTGLILSTWQKLAPMALMIQIPTGDSPLIMIIAILSTLVGGWGGLNQTQLRKIMAYSSIAHLGWMLLIIQYFPHLTLLTLVIYIVMTFTVFINLKINKTTTINTLSTSWTKYPLISTTMPLVLLSLGGLPPLTGFMSKWLILQELTKQNLSTIATIAALSALLSLYFYLRLSYAMTLTSAPNNTSGTTPWRLSPKSSKIMLATTTVSTLLMLPLTPAISAMILG
uniref:NADH-ubiquinone oxidoreductase chain 2 n=1 Tax=Brachygobius doriae TaxID=228544 RepID=A0A343AX41_9GOBI|nr:NADH dehydrogenase subunit 2 [Brachygobius doriae]APT69156.1 NADH dehydrogenase subunit 2 [Brachygobius doriae]